MMGLHFMDAVPFETVYIHPLVRDERGQKMSKSKGNVVDPLQLVDTYGTDALRFTVCALTGPGRDIKLGAAGVESNRRFVTKLWNAARFCEMNGIAPAPDFDPAAARSPLCRWLLDAANRMVTEADAALEAYRFDDYAAAAYRFTWHTFCDWFLEFAKPVLGTAGPDATELRATAAHVLGVILRVLHPAMPFVTEHLWDEMGYGAPCSLIRAPWPQPGPVADPGAVRDELDWVVRLIGAVRGVRSEMQIAPAVLTPILLRDAKPETMARAARWAESIHRLARASSVEPLNGPLPPGSAQIVVDEATVVLPLAGVIDLGVERARLTKERAKALAEAEKVMRKLGNAEFVAKARPEVVEENRGRLAAFQDDAARIEAAIARIAS